MEGAATLYASVGRDELEWKLDFAMVVSSADHTGDP